MKSKDLVFGDEYANALLSIIVKLKVSALTSYVKRNRFVVSVVGLFFAGQMLMIHFHEMWRDELQAWLIARSAHTPLDLYHNLHWEGHPPLWHILLYIVSRVTGNPVAMQLLHILIATAIVYCIVRYSPFSKLHKTLLSFSYFVFFEYGVIARNYNLGVLFIFLFCVLMQAKKKNYYLIGGVLLLTALSNPMSALLVPALGAYVMFDAFQDSLKGKEFPWQKILACGAITLLGLLIFYVFVRQPVGSGIGTVVAVDVRNALSTLWQSYVPIPARVVHFWSTNFILSFDAVVVLTFLLFAAVVQFFSRNLKILATYLIGTGTLIAFFNFKNLGSLRHHGFQFIFFIACSWLLFAQSSRKQQSKGFQLYQWILLTTILFAQFIAMTAAVVKDVRLPFSQAKATAVYIEKSQYSNLQIVGLEDYLATPVIGYLDRTAYYPKSNEINGTFIRWIDQPKLTIREALDRTKREFVARQKELLVLSLSPLNQKEYPELNLVQQLDPSTVVADEVYFIYKMNIE